MSSFIYFKYGGGENRKISTTLTLNIAKKIIGYNCFSWSIISGLLTAVHFTYSRITLNGNNELIPNGSLAESPIIGIIPITVNGVWYEFTSYWITANSLGTAQSIISDLWTLYCQAWHYNNDSISGDPSIKFELWLSDDSYMLSQHKFYPLTILPVDYSSSKLVSYDFNGSEYLKLRVFGGYWSGTPG